MSNKAAFNGAIQNGLGFLAFLQNQDGSFPSVTSNDKHSFGNSHLCPSIFSTAIVLSALHQIKKGEAGRIKARAAKFLLGQKSGQWTFNYWSRGSEWSKKMPYPDDLDDTACALSALFLFNRKLISGEALAKFTLVLTVLEEQEGGPYRTWLAPPTADKVWRDIDLAVNSNVAYFLSLCEVSLPNLSALIETAITNESYCSPYYPSPYPIIYFISRFYRGAPAGSIIDYLLKKRDPGGGWGNSQDTALAVSALINLGYRSADLAKSTAIITRSNSWLPHPFYTGINPTNQKNNYYAGSAALTTALCLEAVNKFSLINAPKKGSDHDWEKEQVGRILGLADSLRGELNEEAGDGFEKISKKLLSSHFYRQIFLLPAIFLKSINSPAKKIPSNLLDRLCLANVLGWAAYTIYDDFLDGEGDPLLLPVANFSFRKMVAIFESGLPRDERFSVIFNKLMNSIDQANYREARSYRCRIIGGRIVLPRSLPNFSPEEVSEKSIGQAVSALRILFFLDCRDSRAIESTLNFFKHYLAAKQLHDDMHDWEDDLGRGYLNLVNVMVLKDHRAAGSRSSRIALAQEMNNLRLIFWRKSILAAGEIIEKQIKLAEESISGVPIFKQSVFKKEFLAPLAGALSKTLQLRYEAVDFIKGYG